VSYRGLNDAAAHQRIPLGDSIPQLKGPTQPLCP